MALGKDRTRINIKGGGLLQLKELPAGSFLDVGYLKESEIIDNHATEDNNAETGEYVGLLLGDRKVIFKSALMQSSKDEIDLIRNSVGKTYEGRYQVPIADGTNVWQLWALGELQIVPNFNLNFSTKRRDIPLELVLLKGGTTGKYYETAEVANEPPLEGDWPDVS